MIEPDHDDAGLDRDAMKIADRIARALLPADPVSKVEAIKAKTAARTTKILRADRINAKEEEARALAELEIRSGVYVSVSDAVIPPTPEWLAMHEHRQVTVQADGEGHHARSVKTVRRIVTSHPARAHLAGKINDRQLKACTWYADRYEECGLDGRVAMSSFEPRIASGLMGGVAFTDRQVEAMDDMRQARAAITAKYRRFFDMVVLNGTAVNRASRIASCRRDPFLTLRGCADEVADFLGLDHR